MNCLVNTYHDPEGKIAFNNLVDTSSVPYVLGNDRREGTFYQFKEDLSPLSNNQFIHQKYGESKVNYPDNFEVINGLYSNGYLFVLGKAHDNVRPQDANHQLVLLKIRGNSIESSVVIIDRHEHFVHSKIIKTKGNEFILAFISDSLLSLVKIDFELNLRRQLHFLLSEVLGSSHEKIVIGINGSDEFFLHINHLDLLFYFNENFIQLRNLAIPLPKNDFFIDMAVLGDRLYLVSFSGNISQVFYKKSSLEIGKTLQLHKEGQSIGFHKTTILDGHLVVLANDYERSRGSIYKINSSLKIVESKTFEFNFNYFLNDIIISSDTVFICGVSFGDSILNSNFSQGLFIQTNTALKTCKTIEGEIPSYKIEKKETESKPSIDSIRANIFFTKTELIKVEVLSELNRLVVCEAIDNGNLPENYTLQSPDLYLEVTGSKGTKSAKGILLRWHLLQEHFPKGNLAQNNYRFNRKDDFVKIYRIPYRPKPKKVDFTNGRFNILANDDWQYLFSDSPKDNVLVRFLNRPLYDSIKTQVSGQNNWQQVLLKQYTGLIEIDLNGGLAFKIGFVLNQVANNATALIEVYSQQNSVENTSSVSARTVWDTSQPSPSIKEENINAVKILCLGCNISELLIETYEQQLPSFFQSSVNPLGDFALTLEQNDPTILRYLQDSSRFKFHNHWEKYQDGAKINIQNYHHRLHDPKAGLRQGIEDYIKQSETDYKANKVYTNLEEAQEEIEVSLYDALSLAALDYHIARMMGLGYIDTPAGSNNEFLYLAAYTAKKSLLEPELIQNLWMSPPVSTAEERICQTVHLAPVQYGVEIDNGTTNGSPLTDIDGYTPDGMARFVKLFHLEFPNFSSGTGFFNTPASFSTFKNTSAILMGIKHRDATNAQWLKPDLAHDNFYKDVNGNFENNAIPLKEDVSKPAYIHMITKNGKLAFGSYGINIFSLASPISDVIVETDNTVLKDPNYLQPPSNLQVQYLELEDPTIFTTKKEQLLLEELNNNTSLSDRTLVRLTFEYNHYHDKNHLFGDAIQIFFRENLPKDVTGKITNVNSNYSQEAFIVDIGDLILNSQNSVIQPLLTAANKNNFIGSKCTIGDYQFDIIDINYSNNNTKPKSFTLKKLKDKNLNLVGNKNVISEQLVVPNDLLGKHFTIQENLKKASSWGNQALSLEVKIGDGQFDNKIETYLNADNEIINRDIRGIWDTANITPFPKEVFKKDINGDFLYQTIQKLDECGKPYTVEEGIKEFRHTGEYRIEFRNKILPHHSQKIDYSKSSNHSKNSVDWHNGKLRIKIGTEVGTQNGTSKNIDIYKEFQVTKTENIGTNNKLILHVVDTEFDPKNTTPIIPTGNSISVNYYPGYKVYLRNENARRFNYATLAPSLPKEYAKTTILGLRTVDIDKRDANNQFYTSEIGIPQPLTVQKVLASKQPQQPTGPLFTTPSDKENLAAYTFFSQHDHEPYGAVFYRADDQAIFSGLYNKTTKDAIFSAIGKDKYIELINFILDELKNGGDFDFSIFQIDEYNDILFTPDKDCVIKTDTPQEYKESVVKAIYSSFISLTEQPLIVEYIRGNTDYIPTKKKQTIRDDYGNKLKATDPKFDQAPMAKKLKLNNSDTEFKQILFTDFTVSGGNNLYFYMVREINIKMQLSESSSILGPVHSVDIYPDPAPVIQKIKVEPETDYYSKGNYPRITFRVIPSGINHFESIEIYRTSSLEKTHSILSMDKVKSIPIYDLDYKEGVFLAYDDFEFDNFDIPYAVPFFYKLVLVRNVEYQKIGDANIYIKKVPSYASKAIPTSMPDVFRPIVPKDFQITVIQKTTEKFNQLEFTWSRASFNSRYKILYLNSAGVWQQVSMKYIDAPSLQSDIKVVDADGEDINLSSITEDFGYYIFSNSNSLAIRFNYQQDGLPMEEDEEVIYHKFKLEVENSSGMVSRENRLVIISEEIKKAPPPPPKPTLPSAITPVETAMPAFVGYTDKAAKNGNSIYGVPTKINSIQEYINWFGKAKNENIQLSIQDNYSINGQLGSRNITANLTNPSSYNLFYSLQLFFANGGATCYVVSVGNYNDAIAVGDGTSTFPRGGIKGGLSALEKVEDITLIAFPDAIGLNTLSQYADIANTSLNQCATLKTRFTILDVYDNVILEPEITSFRQALKPTNLSYGAVYHPFLKTTLKYEFDDTKLIIDHSITGNPPNGHLNLHGQTLNSIKTSQSAIYNNLINEIGTIPLSLPPSAGIAGLYAKVDSDKGVWKAPANIAFQSVIEPSIQISSQQEIYLLNDILSGKSVNPIKQLTGRGINVWGSRTLAGNVQKWRYVQVRRFSNFKEYSINTSLQYVVFEPNDVNTWQKVKSMIDTFLHDYWQKGGLVGGRAAQAYYTKVGLNSSMTQQDIDDGVLRIEVGVAIIRPANYIILRLSYKMN